MTRRRNFLTITAGAVAAGAGLMAAAGTATYDAHPDAELLAYIAAWRAKDRIVKAYEARDIQLHHDGDFDALVAEEGKALSVVYRAPAVTPDGLRAKAAILKQLLLTHHQALLDEGCAGDEIKMAMSLCQDLLGEVPLAGPFSGC